MARSILRFKHLVERGIIDAGKSGKSGRAKLKHLIDTQGFPPGFMLGPNSRAWFEDEVEGWLTSRPSALDPSAKRPRQGWAAEA